jgi:MFS family permease
MKHAMLKTSPLPVLVACGLMVGIFLLDLYAPAGLAIGMLYVAPVALIAMWSPPTHSSLVILSASVCTVLIGLGLFYSSSGPIMLATVSNHFLALGAIWVTVILSLLRKRMEQRIRWIDLLPRL